jgi:hypothetical protein
MVGSARSNPDHPETDVPVTVVGGVPVAVSRATVPGIVVPRTTAQEPGVPAPSLVSYPGKRTKYLLTQVPGITVVEVSHPALQRLLNLAIVYFAQSIAGLKLMETAAGAPKIFGTNSYMGWKNSKTDEMRAQARLKALAFDGMNFESESCKVGFDRQTSLGEKSQIIGKEGEVIDVTQVASSF